MKARFIFCYCAVVCAFILISVAIAAAERASLVIEADSGAVLHAKNARLPSYPASLTKLMTVYLIYEALASKQLALTDRLEVSAAAARMPAVRLGLKPGQTITLEEAVLAMIVRSANDAAVVAAEHIAGNESAFARLMNAKAEALGMSDTVFYNASGLPHPGQVTSARDMAVLARALIADYPQYYSSYSASTFQYRGKSYKTRNNVAGSVEGLQGLKTGFTCHAGFNLVASIEKNGQRLIGVVLGERNNRRRNARMSDILIKSAIPKTSGNKIITIGDLAPEVGQGGRNELNKKAIADVCITGSGPPAFTKASGWGLVLGVRKKEKDALLLSRQIKQQHLKTLRAGRPASMPFLRGVLLYRACITNLKQDNATAACQQLRKQNQYCIVANPNLVKSYVAKGRVALERSLASSEYSQWPQKGAKDAN
ncbi:MAG: D-alanyl-D-alanine carboxypeptidase family protein [Desulfobacterales bacterium]|nr:D-alanyl-D-alanine carboxypeptidase family protein [Desulfobacterales bacterium]